MKRKQFASLLLAGVLAIGTLPGMVYAETENAATVKSIETESKDEDSVEKDTTEATDSSKDAPADTPANAVTETPASQGTTPAATNTPAAATPTPTDAPKESEAAPASEDNKEEDALDTLIRAILTAPDGSETEIPVSGTIEITQEITIPEGKKIVLVPEEDGQDVMLKRSDSFTGDLFVLEKNTSLTIQGTKTVAVTLDGNKDVNTKTEGSLISVSENATLTLGDYVTLQNNKTTATGGAVRNDKGTVILRSVTIKDNQAQYGGAICSTGTIQIGDDTCTDDVTIKISKNKNTEGQDDNLYLLGDDAVVEVQSKLKDTSAVGVSVSDTYRTAAVMKSTEDTVNLEKDVLPYVTAEQ
jgi:predicted outer membrane repeat protein